MLLPVVSDCSKSRNALDKDGDMCLSPFEICSFTPQYTMHMARHVTSPIAEHLRCLPFVLALVVVVVVRMGVCAFVQSSGSEKN